MELTWGETSLREEPLNSVYVRVTVANINYWLHLCPFSMDLASFVWKLCTNSIVELASPLTDQALEANPVDEATRDDCIAWH